MYFDNQGNYVDPEGRMLIPAQAFGGQRPADAAPMGAIPAPAAPAAPALPTGAFQGPDPALMAPAAPPAPEPPANAPIPPGPPPPSSTNVAIPGLPQPVEVDAISGATAPQAAAAEAAAEAAPPAPGQPAAPSAVDQWYDLEKRKAAWAGNANTQVSAEQQKAIDDKRDAEAELAAWGAEERKRLAEDMEAYSKARIDPMRAFTGASAWQQIGAVIGMAMGSLTKSGKNPALDIAFRIIDKDLEAQRANADLDQRSLSVKQSLYSLNLEAKQNEEVARNLTRAQMLETMKQKLATDFENNFANDELALNYTKMLDEIEAEKTKSLMAADQANLDQAGKLANIDKTLAEAAKLRADTNKILSKIGLGTGGPVPTAAAPAARTNDLLTKLYPKGPPSSFGSPNVKTVFREARGGGGGAELAPALEGHAIVADDKTRDNFVNAASSADKMLAVYKTLENSFLGRELSWDDNAIRNRQLTAEAFKGAMQAAKGAGALSDRDMNQLMEGIANLTNPNAIKSMKSEESRRKVFTNARQILSAGTMRDYQSLKHLARLPNGEFVEVEVAWNPRGLTPTLPKEVGDETAVTSTKSAIKAIGSGAPDQIKVGATSVLDGTSRAVRGDADDVSKALREVRGTLGALTRARKNLVTAGPFPNENRGAEIRAKLKGGKDLSDAEHRKLREELLDSESADTVRRAARDPKAKAELERLETSLREREKALRARQDELDKQARQPAYRGVGGGPGLR